MKHPPLHFALRETQMFLRRPLTLGLLGFAILFLGLIGPFGTYETLPFVARLGYWLLCLPLTFVLGSFINIFIPRMLHVHFPKTQAKKWLSPLSAAFFTAVAISGIVVGLNWLFYDLKPTFSYYIDTGLLPLIMLVTALVSLAIFVLSQSPTPQHSPPPLLERLEFDKRGALISLSVQDHYVEITTTKGTSMVLMRLRDAMRETQGIEGLQIHRSHWVARDHIENVTKKDAKPFVVLSDQRQLPVSRSFLEAVKEAGLLPRKTL